MIIRIETDVEPADIKAFLQEHQPNVPVFFDERNHLVLRVNRRSRLAALELIGRLLSQSGDER